MIGQIVEVAPQIDAPINIGLGSLPMVLGSFAGAGLLFWVGTTSKATVVKTVTKVGALGLAAFGVFNIFSGKEAAAAETIPGGGESAGDVSYSGGEAGASAPIAPTAEGGFASLEGRVISPTEWQTIPLSPFEGEVPVRIRVTNPSAHPITFDLVLESNEIPEPFGGEQINVSSSRVSLGAGEMRDIDIPLALATWGWSADTVDVYLTVRKRRTTGGDAALLDLRHFVVD